MKIKTLTPNQPDFPAALKELSSCPKQLYYLGDISAARNTSVAIVGSRKVTAYGRQVTEKVVQALSNYQVTIVSGLALGVDSVAHEAALNNHAPTIAVMPCGLNEIYPRTHHNLAKRILAAGGALVSEYPEDTPPLRQHFIARNRIVSGLAQAVIVTEAAEKSGTLHTANFALEQGRTVLAVPGNITSPLSQGTNSLIKAGADPVTKPEDVLFALSIDQKTEKREILGDTPEEVIILQLMASGVGDVDDLQQQSQLNPAIFNQTLTMLEIQGKIRSHGSGHWAIT